MVQATRPATQEDIMGRGSPASVDMGPQFRTPVPDPTALTTDQLRREIGALRELLNARLDAMDRAVTLLQDRMDGQPSPSVLQERTIALRAEMMQMFQTDVMKFAELDKRTEALTVAGKIAIDAAFKAQQEAANKQEMQFTKVIDQTRELMQTSQSALAVQINDLKSRLDKGEGVARGVVDHTAVTNRTEDRSSTMMNLVIAGLMAAVGIMAFIMSRTS